MQVHVQRSTYIRLLLTHNKSMSLFHFVCYKKKSRIDPFINSTSLANAPRLSHSVFVSHLNIRNNCMQ